jgi:hypothetical protein
VILLDFMMFATKDFLITDCRKHLKKTANDDSISW